MESFGTYIRNLRIEKGLNQTELAALVGLDSGGLSKVENNKKSINQEKLLLFAKALEIDLEVLKKQYLSDVFARETLKYKVSNDVYQLAEDKTEYYKNINTEQGKLEL